MIEKIKETGIYFIGTLGVAILSFVISLLYTRMFSPEDYGTYSLIAALYNLLFQLLTGWMTHSILRYYPGENERDGGIVFRNTILRIHGILFSFFCLIIFVLLFYYRKSKILCSLLSVYLGVFLFEGLLLIFNAFLRAEGNSKKYSINTILNSIIKSISIMVLFYICKYTSITVIVISLFVAECFQCVYVYIKFHWFDVFRKGCFDIQLAKKIIKFGYPLIGVSIIFNILTYSDRYIISFFENSSNVGLYSYGYNMGYTLFYTMTNTIMLGAYPRIVQEWKVNGRKGAENAITNYLSMFFYLMIPAMLGVVAIGNKMIRTLCDESFWNTSSVFIITCISYTLYGFLQYTNKAWELTARTKMILFLNIIAAIINIILNFTLIPYYGFVIAAYTTMFSFLVYIILSLTLSKKIFSFRIELTTICNICISAFFMFILTILIDKRLSDGFLYLLLEIAIACFVYFISLVLIRDKNILNFIKRLRMMRINCEK